MKLSFDTDKIVEGGVKFAIVGYDKAKKAAPTAKKSVLSFSDRIMKAAKRGVKAARS